MNRSYHDIIKYISEFDKFKENPDLLEVAKLLLKDAVVDGDISRQQLKTNAVKFMMPISYTSPGLPVEDFVFKHNGGTDNRAGIGELISKIRNNNSISKQLFVLIVELEKCKLEFADETKIGVAV